MILIFVASVVLAYLICSSTIAMTKKALAESAARRGGKAGLDEPDVLTELDVEIGWTALDDVQLRRLLKDSAP